MPRRGRPSLSGLPGSTLPIGIRLPDPYRTALERRAAAQHVSVSSVIREIIADAIERDEDEDDEPRRRRV